MFMHHYCQDGELRNSRAIMNLDKFSGISIMKIVSKLDAGPIMMQSKLNINPDTTYSDLSEKMSELASVKILDALNDIEKNRAIFIPQNNEEATYAKKIEKSETKIKWKENAKNIIAKINALYPNPGSWFELNGLRIKVKIILEDLK